MDRGSPLFPEARKRHRVYRGLTGRQERIFNWIAAVVVILLVGGWIGAWMTLRRQHADEVRTEAETGIPAAEPSGALATDQITSRVFERGAPKTAYVNDKMLQFLDPLRGESGKLRFATRQPGSPIVPNAPVGSAAKLSGGTGELTTKFTAPPNAGIYKLAVQIDKASRAIEDLNVITLVPLAKKRAGKIGLYYLGSWPFEGGGKPRSPEYATPSGFIEVTAENQNTYVSEHFRLRDFLTKDQPNVWPKYLPLNPKLVDKLELTIAELKRRGLDVKHVSVMSGFRTPRYNHGSGNTAGRANLSRHMYGDAADVFVDNDSNGTMDDLNRDGRVTARDAEVLMQAVEQIEKSHPSLTGGIGVYPACCGHGPFVHVDVRGFRARWRGTGNG